GPLSLSWCRFHITFQEQLPLVPSLYALSHSASPTNNRRLPFHSSRSTTLVLLHTLPSSCAKASAVDSMRERRFLKSAGSRLLGVGTAFSSGTAAAASGSLLSMNPNVCRRSGSPSSPR